MAFQTGSKYDSMIGTFAQLSAQQIDNYIHQTNPQAPFIGGFYKEFEEEFNLRSDYMVAQSILETNFYGFPQGNNFPPANYFNPAGLKNISGQFIKFPNWRCGVKAHFERIGFIVRQDNPPADCDKPGDNPNWRYTWLLEREFLPELVISVSRIFSEDDYFEYSDVWVDIRNNLVLEAPNAPFIPQERPLLVQFGNNAVLIGIAAATIGTAFFITRN